MLEKIIEQLRNDRPNLPNKFSIALGEKIRQARNEAKISQAELAEISYLKQSSISRIEFGLRAISSEDILFLSYALNKPISYFFPKELLFERSKEEELQPLEKELLMHIRRLGDDDLRRLIAQARALVDLEESKFKS